MVLRDNLVTRSIFEIVFYLFTGLFFTVVLPIIAGLSFQGFEESFSGGFIDLQSYLGTYLFYVPLIIISLFVIIFSVMNALLIRKGEHPATQENPGFARMFTMSFIFNPEQSLLWQLTNGKGMKWSLNILRVTMFAILFFGLIGIFHLFLPELSVAGVPQALPQQASAFSDVVFGSGIPSFSENGALLFVLSMLSGIVAYMVAKFMRRSDKKTKLFTFYTIELLLIAPLMGLLWMSFHSIVYGNSEADLIATFIFGYAGATLTILTGIFLWWFIWHFFNNFVIKLSEIATSQESLVFVFAIMWFITLVVYGLVEFFVFKRKGKGEQVLTTG